MGAGKCSRKLKTLMSNRRKKAQKCCFFHSAEAAAQTESLHEHRESRVQIPQRHRKRSISQKSTARKKPHEQKFLTLRERCGNVTQRFNIPVVSALRSDASEPRSVLSEPRSDASEPRSVFSEPHSDTSEPRNEFSAHNNLSISNRNRKYPPLNLIRHD